MKTAELNTQQQVSTTHPIERKQHLLHLNEKRALEKAASPTQSEDRFRLLSNALPLSIIHTDRDGNAIYVNEKWERLSGLTAQSSLGFGWQACIHADFRETIAVCWQKSAQQETSFASEVRLATNDGIDIWVSAAVTSLGVSDGRHNGFVWTFEDISTRVVAEQNMKTQLEVTRSISAAASLEEAAFDIVEAICSNTGWQAGVFWDLTTRESEVLNIANLSNNNNLDCSEMVRQLSVAYDDLVIKETLRFRKPVWSVNSNEDDSDRSLILAKYKICCRLLLPIVTARHVVGIIELFGTSLRKPSAETVNMFNGLANQIGEFAERVAAEARLRESDGKIRAMVDSAVDGIVTIDTKGVVDSCNPAFQRMFGYEPFMIIGYSASVFLPGKQTIDDFVKLLESHKDVPQEMFLKAKNGTLIPVEMSVSKVGAEKTEFYTFIVRDVSERKIVERRVSEFYSTVSHELRTPLTSIRGALGLVEGGIVGEVPPKVLEMVRIARSGSDRLIRLINDILDLRKIEAGKMELKLAEVDANDVVEKTLAEIKGFADENQILISSDIDEPFRLRLDQDRIIQVLTNLISNAIKFSDAGKSVHVAVSKSPVEDKIRFSIIDQGMGIQSEDLPKLFGLFQQLDSSDTRENGGSGLGLAISKAIVEVHGGEIGVESIFGNGSTFWFDLPRSPG